MYLDIYVYSYHDVIPVNKVCSLFTHVYFTLIEFVNMFVYLIHLIKCLINLYVYIYGGYILYIIINKENSSLK